MLLIIKTTIIQMVADKISQLIKGIGPELFGKKRLIDHLFFGRSVVSKSLIEKIVEEYPNAIVIDGCDSLTVTVATTISEDRLHEDYIKMEAIASYFGVDYDGFEVSLQSDQSVDQKVCRDIDLHEHYKPGSYLRVNLDGSKFGYVLFLGGSKAYGSIFEVLSVVCTKEDQPNNLDDLDRLYRQPVLGFLDVDSVEYVSSSNRAVLPAEVLFRLELNYPELDLLESLVAINDWKDGLDGEEYIKFIDYCVRKGHIKKRDGAYKGRAACYKLNRTGRLSSKEIYLEVTGDIHPPLPWGIFLDENRLASVLLNGVDEIKILDDIL